MLWAPYTTNNGQWIANKVLQGLVGAPIESLCEISISDVVRCLPCFYVARQTELMRGSLLVFRA